MLRDLRNYSIVYLVCMIVLIIATVLINTLAQMTPPSGLALISQIVAPAMTGQLHFKRNGTSAGIGYSFKFGFLGALLTVLLSTLVILAIFVVMSVYFTRSPVDGLGFIWVMSGLAATPAIVWAFSVAILIPVVTIINFTMFKLGIMVMRWTIKRKGQRAANLLTENGN